jgi:hypothetical protein
VPAGLPVSDDDRDTVVTHLFRSAMSGLLMSAVHDIAVSARDALRVDGAYAVWQPSASRE